MKTSEQPEMTETIFEFDPHLLTWRGGGVKKPYKLNRNHFLFLFASLSISLAVKLPQFNAKQEVQVTA